MRIKIKYKMKYIFLLLALITLATLHAQDGGILEVNLKTINNKTTDFEEISKKEDLILLALWATWCVPCINELDAINDVYEEWQEETNIKLYAVSIDDSRTSKRVKPLTNGKGWKFDILLDTNNDLKRALGVSTVPFTVLIKKGEIVYKHSGYSPGAEDELYEEIKNNL